MDIKTRYKYFVARLDHEVKKRGHGGKAEIGNAIGLKGGSFIGQLLNKKLNKNAGVDTQIAIAEFCCGSEERFIEEGKQLVELGCILSEIPQIKIPIIYNEQPQPPLVNFQDEADKRHAAVIAEFEDKERAIRLNQKLIELEKLDPNRLDLLEEVLDMHIGNAREKKGLLPLSQKNGTNPNP